jgi:hypothetical protein
MLMGDIVTCERERNEVGGKGEEQNDGQEGMMDRSDGQKRIDGHQL